MPLDATVGGPNANAYETVAEAQLYWDTRPHPEAWDDADDQEVVVIAATRMMDVMLSLRRYLRTDKFSRNSSSFYVTPPAWTGAPTTTTQSLAWPRTGMLDRNGNPIAPTIIPLDLKNAVAELAGQLAKSDRLIDNETAAQGISSVRAGSVSVSFKADIEMLRVLPSIIYEMLVPSWMTDELIEPAMAAYVNIL